MARLQAPHAQFAAASEQHLVVIFDADAAPLHYLEPTVMPNALKVLHVYSGNLFGGVERMLISVAKLNTSDSPAHFALCFEGRLSHALQATAAAVKLLGPVRLRHPLSVLRARRALSAVLRTGHFDRVLCHSIWTYCIFAPVVARAGLDPILFLHDIPDPHGPMYRWAWRKPPAVCIVNSSTTAEPLGRMRPAIPVHVVHPLVGPPPVPDLEAVAKLRAQWHARPEDVVILQASRFDSWKGHRNLLQALGTMRNLPGWRCWIAGSPQRPDEEKYRQELMRLVDSLRIQERVSFIGHRDDMEVALAACDVYCQPNETPEPFGMVFIEAMYAGKPVVGRALGGALEIVTPDCGILCPPDPGSLSTALERLVKDGNLREEMSHAGPTRAAALCGPEAFNARLATALDSLGVRPSVVT